LADRLEEIGLDAFLDVWTALPLFAGLADDLRFMTQRRTNTVAGLASSLRLAGTGAMEPVWDRLPELAMPVLLVTGGDDGKFTGLARQVCDVVPTATHVVLPGAGHTAHLEDVDGFVAAVRAWEAGQAAANSPAASSTPKTS
jgi:pimeloyl-ACP methyl ester carboxylesterase